MLESGDLFFWGKAKPSPEATATYHPVAYHLLDVAAVARQALAARPLLLQRIARLLRLAPEDARLLLTVLIALHDIGKFAPAFAAKVPDLWPGATLGAYQPEFRVARPHTEDGLVLFEERLRDLVLDRVIPGGGELLDSLAPAVFGHHGRPVGIPPFGDSSRNRFGQGLDPALRCADAVIGLMCHQPVPVSQMDDGGARLASWLVSGLITVSDWIGSNEKWFPYQEPDREDLTLEKYWGAAQMRAWEAVQRSGFQPPQPSGPTSFSDLTGLTSPETPAQTWASSIPLPEGPLLVLIEDSTGSGKTEAAQMFVHRLMSAGRVTGAYWAMPTMATANAMYERQRKVLSRLFSANGPPPSLALAHSAQRLHGGFRANVLEFDIAQVPSTAEESGTDSELPSAAACAAFLADNGRRALLADLGAGTVDQAFLGILPSRFNTMRLLGLSGKVLVIDEAHAYDAYMGIELQELLRFQAALGGCAVVLSATLPGAVKGTITEAWLDGSSRGGGRRTRTSRVEQTPLPAYPSGTLVASAISDYPLESAPWSRREVPVRLVHDLASVLDHLRMAASAGAAVAWIRNTVKDCIAGAECLRNLGVPTLVFHARFAQCDRQRREAEVLARFGKRAPLEARRGIVVVATQVIEQSLDLDFDAMATDLAPIDLIIQRAGRFQRHPERHPYRPAGLPGELLVFSPPATDAPGDDWLGEAFKGTRAVYDNPAILWRTVRALSQSGVIATPGNVRDLVEAVYGSDEVPAALEIGAGRAEGRAGAHASLANYTTLKPAEGYYAGAQAWLNESRVPTRLGHDTVPLRLARVEGDKLLPWADSSGPPWEVWALSEVRVRTTMLPMGPQVPPNFAAQTQAIQANWGRFERDIQLLPLRKVGESEWSGELEGQEGKGARYSYRPEWGLTDE